MDVVRWTKETRWQRFKGNFTYNNHHILILFGVISVALWIILLTGCHSNILSTPNIFLLELTYTGSTLVTSQSSNATIYTGNITSLAQQASLNVRVGFFSSVCVATADNVDSQGRTQWTCGDAGDLAIQYGSSSDPLGLILLGQSYSHRVIFYGLILGSTALTLIALLIMASTPGWQQPIRADYYIDDGDEDADGEPEEFKPFPPKHINHTGVATAALSFMFGLVSMLWIQVAAVAFGEGVSQSSQGLITTHVGAAAAVVGWLAVFLNGVVLLALIVFSTSIQLLEMLTDDD